jgi:predicted HicB family RNase H-like nuclease
MNAVEKYTYRVFWSEEDEEFVGLCAEFPSLSWLDASRDAALAGIVRVVTDAVADMADNGEAVPEPVAARTYSGELRVRMAPGLHKRLAIEAAEKGTSLNRVIVNKLIACDP